VLRITKQSLGRVLSNCSTKAYIVQQTGKRPPAAPSFRHRQGGRLVAKLAAADRPINHALAGIGLMRHTVRQFLRAMIDHDDPTQGPATILASGGRNRKRQKE